MEHNKGEAGPIMGIDNIFFSLLKLGTGLSDSVSLPTMNRDLWRSVFRMAEKHAMPGIMVDAVNALPNDVNKPDRDLLMKLISFGIKIEKKNRLVNSEAVKWSGFFREKGVSFQNWRID